MFAPHLSLRLIGESRAYAPGQTLTGEYFIDIENPHEVKAVEVSILWYTEGKGDEDMQVHHFERRGNDNGEFVDMRSTQQFQTELPQSPLSYDGILIKIHWCARLRVFVHHGKELVTEQPFQLGAVPRVRPAAANVGEMSASDREKDESQQTQDGAEAA